MKRRLQTWALALGVVALASGCSSLRPLTSTPPAPVITLKSPATVKHFLTTTVLPAGDYRATMEDKKGYYYQAPAKIITYDMGSTMTDGGLYLEKGSRVPMKYYLISADGQHGKSHLKVAPAFEFKPAP